MYPMRDADCGRCTTVTTAAPCMGANNRDRGAAVIASPACRRCGRSPCACQTVTAPCATATTAARPCPDTREEALRRVQQYGFMTDDIRLFLNTHPGCEGALDALQRYIALEKAEKEEFEKRYGPLTLEAMESRCAYDWIACPWPWHVEG